MPPPPPQLMDELVEEILLRLPPGSPASLVRAGLVCKRWCHLVSDPGFQRRFREHHRSPPILGFLNACIGDDDYYGYTTSFVPEPASGLRRVDLPRLHPRECRHGRVLLHSYGDTADIVVWDPITSERVQLPEPPPPFLLPNTWTAAVLCAAAADPRGTCDHLDCHGGPFIVVLVVQDMDDLCMSSYVYSSESGAWSEPTSSPHCGGRIGWPRSALLVGNALYFGLQLPTIILQYDFGIRKIAAIHLPKSAQMDRISEPIELIATKDGRLGFASVEQTKLSLWSREVDGGGRWALCQVIDLEKLLPVDATRDTIMPYCLSGSAEGTGVIFLRIHGRQLIAIDLWSGRVMTKVYEREPRSYNINVVPYMSFFTPVLSRPPYTDEDDRPEVSASSMLEGPFLGKRSDKVAYLGMSATCSK